MTKGSRRTPRVLAPPGIAVALALLVAGCTGTARQGVTVETAPDVTGQALAMGGARIGLLADARLQTSQSMGATVTDDDVDNVELRPPALGHLAPDMLAYFLDRLIEEKRVDLILFLGNAANNGCEDELRRSFDILRSYRDRRDIPIFFVIGNHDYLGAGYTPDMSRRSLYCNDKSVPLDGDTNKPVDKFELIAMVHEFNVGNFSSDNAAQMQGWGYTHSFDRSRLKQACIVDDPLRDQHVKLGCYYAAKLVHRDGSEILLADTSDYHHEVSMANFDIPVSKNKWYGLTGWISVRDGARGCEDLGDRIVPQVQWFHCHRAQETPPVRIVAAHYPVKSLSPIGRKVSRFSRLLCHLSPMLQPRSRSGDYWFSADTHLQPYLIKQTTDVRNCEAYPDQQLVMRSLNIGSIMDYDWSPVLGTNTGYEQTPDMAYAAEHEPHAVAVRVALEEDSRGNRLAVDKVITDVRTCTDVLAALRARPTADAPVYTRVMDSTDYRKLFGLDKSHKDPDWTHDDQLRSRRNLQRLIGHLSGEMADRPGLSEGRIKACVALESARLAGSLQTRSFECETCPAWRIMRRIEEEKSAHY